METRRNFFPERSRRRYHARNKSRRKTTHDLARQHQDVDRAIVGGSSEDNGGSFTVEEDCIYDAAKPRNAGEG